MRYVFRIYRSEYSYSNYDDNIWRMKESSVNKNDIDVEVYCDDYNEIEKAFCDNIEIFTGATFCLKDTDTDKIITGGKLEPTDIVMIKQYFNKR